MSTTLRANGQRADGSDDGSWTKKTVPMAPFPKTLRALRFSRLSSGKVLDGDGASSMAGSTEREREKEGGGGRGGREERERWF